MHVQRESSEDGHVKGGERLAWTVMTRLAGEGVLPVAHALQVHNSKRSKQIMLQ
jgi:hypothetical protein